MCLLNGFNDLPEQTTPQITKPPVALGAVLHDEEAKAFLMLKTDETIFRNYSATIRYFA